MAIGLGTYRLGENTLRVCLDAFELGYRHIDTASLYGNEAAVGEAVRQSCIDREEIVVTSKVWIDDIRSGAINDSVARSVDKIGQVDVMLLHAPVGGAADLTRSWTSLIEACERHEIPSAGVSNYRLEHLDALPSTPSVNQIEATPFLPRTDVAAHCQQEGILVTAHSPLAKAQRLDHPVLIEIADEIQLGDGPVTAAQLLLAWSRAKGLIPLPCSSSRLHLAENLAAMDLTLQPGLLARLDALFDGYATHRQHL